ncbi:MAG: 5-deoxy-glucuronate isomerase [Bryobacteraceae bacterium]|nr:5-deoxy-glucuronate isomerase [Bryobacteraceae bacterium]
MPVHPGTLIKNETAGVMYRQRFTPAATNLLFLSTGEYAVPPGAHSGRLSLRSEEALLWMWKGAATVTVDGAAYALAPYDTLYIPKGAEFQIANASPDAPAMLWQTSALADNVHPVYHAKFAEVANNEARIRRLKGKNVYLMFDVSEPADKLIAGYTFFEPYARSWPPHNHTDQEEVYIFIQGQGSMEVYETEESLSFVHSVKEGDMVTIPFLNYHPVFSQAEPLQFIWCIAGERYWVGDKNKQFMQGTADKITT